jgi:general stress protein 26
MMDWPSFVNAASSLSWVAYFGTADRDGRPHVSAVSPGFSPETMWVATRPASKKARNVAVNPNVAFHWPVGVEGPGELVAFGTATIHLDRRAVTRIWNAGHMTFDLESFFGPRDEADVAFIEIAVGRARLLGPDFRPSVWERPAQR